MKKIILIIVVILCIVGGMLWCFILVKDNDVEENVKNNIRVENNSNIVSNTNKFTNEVRDTSQEIEVTIDEILENADKKISPTGFAGASNNVVVLDEGTLLLYNRSSRELVLLATGVADIRLSDDEENIVVEKEECYVEEEELPNFIIVE